MPNALKTVEELEALLKDPTALESHIRDVAVEAFQADDVQDTIKDNMRDAVKASGLTKRPPVGDDPATHEKQTLLQRTNSQGKELNGAWDNFGQFLGTCRDVRMGTIDSRLKVLGESQGDQGGFLVPEEFRMQLLAMALEMAIIRPRAFMIPMATPTMRIPTIRDTTHANNVFGGVSAYWVNESGGFTESEPTFSQVRLEAKKLTGYTSVANELMADSAIALEALLVRLFGEALRWFEEEAFFNGGGGGEPLGVLNSDPLITVAKVGTQAANTIIVENIDEMFSRMLPSSQGSAIWIANPNVYPQLAALSRAVGSAGGSPVWMSNVAAGPPMTVYGRPLMFSEHCQTLGTAGDIYFADLSYYIIGDRQALTVEGSPHVRFANDETVWRFIERLDGRPWLDTALQPKYGETLSPFVTLATRA